MPDFFEEELTARAMCSRMSAAAAASGPRAFALAGDKPHYARDLVVDVRHIKLEIRDRPGGEERRRHGDALASARSTTACGASTSMRSRCTISGRARSAASPRASTTATRCCTCSSSVRCAPAPRRKSRSRTARSPAAGSTSPRRTRTIPNKPLQAWTQGQDEDSRHWYPCIDFPNHQQTSEVIVTVPAR